MCKSLAIQAPLATPPVHPKDKSLLRPLSELGKNKSASAGTSFLRRTEYISTGSSRTADSFTPKNSSKPRKIRKEVDTSKDDPITILRAAVRGFDIAYPQDAYDGPDAQDGQLRGSEATPAELEAWRKPKHPENPELRLLDAYSLKPDLDAFTDSGAYQIIKFTANPTPVTDSYDTRLDIGFLQPKTLAAEAAATVKEETETKMEAHQADPSRNPAPGPMNPYELYLPRDLQAVKGIKRKFDVDDPDNNDDELYGPEGESFRYDHIRPYDTARSTANGEYIYKEVALALHDPDLEHNSTAVNGETHTRSNRLEKAAYYYPISAKQQIRPRRNKNMAHLGLAMQTGYLDEQEIDALAVQIGDPGQTELESRQWHRQELESFQEDDEGAT